MPRPKEGIAVGGVVAEALHRLRARVEVTASNNECFRLLGPEIPQEIIQNLKAPLMLLVFA